MMSTLSQTKRLLAVASGGGHWIQLQRLTPAFADMDVTYATTNFGASAKPEHRVVRLPDANANTKGLAVLMLLRVLWLILRVRPHVIVSTGAAPGLFAILIGRMLGARTVWIDSVANASELSRSGRVALKWASLCLTQWPHLARPEGPHYMGNVL